MQYENLDGWEKLNLGQHLTYWAEKFKDSIAVIDYEDEISYTELDQKATALASAFIDLGIQKNDKVVVQLPNRISFVVVLFALVKAGAIPILALPAHREAELEGILRLAMPTAYIVAE